MEFWSENEMMYQNEKWAHDGNFVNWYIAEYKSLKFLFINSSFQYGILPLLITEVDSSSLQFKLFGPQIVNGSMQKIPKLEPRTNFLGTWEEESTTDRLAFFHYLEMDSAYNYNDSIAELRFTSDSIYISQFNLHANFSIKTSHLKTHLRLKLPLEAPEGISPQWHVTNPNDSTLKVFTYTSGYWTSGVAQVWFRKKR